jgi:hypothetical protein
MTTETKRITAVDVPIEAVDALRPHAVRAGIGCTNSDVLKFAVVELERRIREEQAQPSAPQRTS